jgi:bis(5'-nucleosyl)-tetraphosphatase (symmetrical)
MRYVIGDIQGCYQELCDLLDLIRFNPARDEVWFCGDLVNRGPQSAEVLRLIMGLKSAARVVLGNHDFFLLRVALGLGKPHPGDTHEQVLQAPDAPELLTWLRHQPLVVSDGNLLMVHAGLLPQWTRADAVCLNGEITQALQSEGWQDFLRDVFGNESIAWSPQLTGLTRHRAAVNGFCRLRYCDAYGRLEFGYKLAGQHPDPHLLPWWAHPHRKSAVNRVFTGHWSSLGLLLTPTVSMLDSGCLWGGSLTALAIDSGQVWQVPADPNRILSAD